MSMGSLSRSRGGASVEPDEGKIGMLLCRLGLWGSGEKGLRRSASEDAIMAGACRDRVCGVELVEGRTKPWTIPPAAARCGACSAAGSAQLLFRRAEENVQRGAGRACTDRANLAMRRVRRSMRRGWIVRDRCGEVQGFYGERWYSSAVAPRVLVASAGADACVFSWARCGCGRGRKGAPPVQHMQEAAPRSTTSPSAGSECLVPWTAADANSG